MREKEGEKRGVSNFGRGRREGTPSASLCFKCHVPQHVREFNARAHKSPYSWYRPRVRKALIRARAWMQLLREARLSLFSASLCMRSFSCAHARTRVSVARTRVSVSAPTHSRQSAHAHAHAHARTHTVSASLSLAPNAHTLSVSLSLHTRMSPCMPRPASIQNRQTHTSS
eukprot:734572-Rhodomonas_salina.1